jgi:beta-glucosidase
MAVRFMARLLFPLMMTCALGLPGQAPTGNSSPAYLNTSLPIDQRVDDLISRLTLEEKVRQMQHTAPEIPRLGVPSYDWSNEALHGVAHSGYATIFPQAIGMAATWDANLVHLEAETIATEARAKYNQAQREGNHSNYFGIDFWSPNINIFRDPRWGRGQETYGEDPFLTARLGVAFVTGLQGDNPQYYKVIATPKHYAVHSGPEPLRHGFNVHVSPHDLEDTYLPAFRATVVEGHADSVMCAYNALDGTPACANKFLLQDTLRDTWKFQGYVTSDCGAVGDITTGHKFTPDNEHGAAAAVRAGTDTTCGDEYVALVEAVHDGLIKESEIDTSLKRLFTARFRLGMFDPPGTVAFNQIPYSEDDSPQHRQLALRAARQAIVLLKNQDGILPLKPGLKTLAVIGPNAESLEPLEGNYSGTPSHAVYPLEGMRKLFGDKTKIVYAEGSPYVEQVPVPVPSCFFHLADEADRQGLKGEYYSNTDFSGKPVLTRVDPQIQFYWNAAAPVPGVSWKAFSVRWTGMLTPPAPGAYTFSVGKPGWPHGSDKRGFRVFFDGQLVIDTLPPSPRSQLAEEKKKQEGTFQVNFKDTQPHALRVEYMHEAPPIFGAGALLSWQPPLEVLPHEAVRVAEQADVVAAFVGLSPILEGEQMPIQVPGFQGGDRTDIGLPAAQQQLLEALAATGKPLVVVLMNGSPLAVSWAQEHAAAVVEAWYPGEEGGTAIAETLAGVNNPSGRLPITFYASLDQLPPFEDYSMQNRTYRYFQGKPLYAFGYGLSYSSFAYSNLKLSALQLQAGAPLAVQADVRNTSKMAGDEVAELYLEFPPSAGAPARALRGFARVHLLPGENRPVSYTLNARDLSMVNEQGERVVAPGEYTLFVGGAQPGDAAGGVKAKFTITGETKLPW